MDRSNLGLGIPARTLQLPHLSTNICATSHLGFSSNSVQMQRPIPAFKADLLSAQVSYAVQRLEYRLYTALKALRRRSDRKILRSQFAWARAFDMELAPAYWLLGMSCISGHPHRSALIQALWTELQQASHRFNEIDLSGYHPTPVEDDPLPKWWLAADPHQGVAQFREMFLPVDLDEQKKPPISEEAELCDFQNLVNLYRHLILKELQHDAAEYDTDSDQDNPDSDLEDMVDQLASDVPMEESNPGNHEIPLAPHPPSPLRADGDVESNGRSSKSSSSSSSDEVEVFSIHGAGSPSPSKVGRAAESSSDDGTDRSPSPSSPGGTGEKRPNDATNLYPADRVLDDAWDAALGVLQVPSSHLPLHTLTQPQFIRHPMVEIAQHITAAHLRQLPPVIYHQLCIFQKHLDHSVMIGNLQGYNIHSTGLEDFNQTFECFVTQTTKNIEPTMTDVITSTPREGDSVALAKAREALCDEEIGYDRDVTEYWSIAMKIAQSLWIAKCLEYAIFGSKYLSLAEGGRDFFPFNGSILDVF
ncbi:hypothetical protein JAAARDRAFT_197865 [Jaapia argillacea MUCL 33604]|uniref:Uncharacterized protein n=1 Tax=Jaapia argillacea MUCL 33604 TaxID=933084 RepID=A0A067PE94_9AGAM|nr:hypothetical protein JAAARDRAFT_197865 [Jaapia argillacea MUCL 33604]